MFDNVIQSTSAKFFRIKGKKISKDFFLNPEILKKNQQNYCVVNLKLWVPPLPLKGVLGMPVLST